MSESKAHIAILVVGSAVVAVAVFGLAALGANGSTIALGLIIPAMVAAYLSSRVVMHYDDEAEDRHR